MRKKYILIALIVWILLIGLGFYFYNKPHTNAAHEKTDVSINATELFEEFQRNETIANSRFVDKIIEVKGTVLEVQHSGIRTSLQLDAGNAGGGVNCSLADSSPNIQIPQKGALIIIKGKCAGFLMDVNLVDCVVKE